MSAPTRLLDYKEVCELLHIGVTTFYVLVNEGSLRTVKIGRSRRVSDAEVSRFIQERESAGMQR